MPLGFTTGLRSLARRPSRRMKETTVVAERSVPMTLTFDFGIPVEAPMQRVTHWRAEISGSGGAVVPPPVPSCAEASPAPIETAVPATAATARASLRGDDRAWLSARSAVTCHLDSPSRDQHLRRSAAAAGREAAAIIRRPRAGCAALL